MEGTLVRESVTQGSLKVDRAARLIRGVRLINENSRNGYSYSREALREAISLYDGTPVFAPHNTDERTPRDPLAADAYIQSTRFEEINGKAGLTADLDVAPGERGDRFLWLAEKHASSAGMSHDARVVMGEAA